MGGNDPPSIASLIVRVHKKQHVCIFARFRLDAKAKKKTDSTSFERKSHIETQRAPTAADQDSECCISLQYQPPLPQRGLRDFSSLLPRQR
jgi:hypothetical protein